MRAWVIAAAFAVAALVGAALWTVWPPPPAHEIQARGRRALAALLAAPARTADLDAAYAGAPGGALHVLLDPAAALPQWHRFGDDARALARFERTCDDGIATSPAVDKARRWARFRCGIVAAPDDAFFWSAPLMHPSGRSFAALASAVPTFASPRWRRAHLPLFHALELSPSDPGVFGRLASLSRPGLRALARGDLVALGPGAAALRTNTSAVGASWAVAFVDRAGLDAAMRAQGVRLGARDATCAAPATPRLCFDARPPARETLAAVGAIALATLAAAGVAARRQRRRRADDDRAFLIRTLTHELRTPATALKLRVHAMRAAYDELPAPAQDAVLQLSDDVERLDRVLAVTGRALSVTSADAFRVELLPSLRTWLAEQLQRHDDTTVELAVDGPFRTDPRWLQVILHNLVANAHAHGAPPVRVRARREGRWLVVEVADGGDTRGTSLREMTTPFRRGRGSRGLGLGLGIVARAARELGGALRHRAEPTTFTVRLRDGGKR